MEDYKTSYMITVDLISQMKELEEYNKEFDKFKGALYTQLRFTSVLLPEKDEADALVESISKKAAKKVEK